MAWNRPIPGSPIVRLTAAVVLVDTIFFAALTPLLPHYAATFGLGKAGAGLLNAAYPLGTFVGAIPSGIVTTRFGTRRTVLVGLGGVALTTVAFGFAGAVWQLDTARFVQGVASSFSWTGALSWLVATAPEGQRGKLIGQALGAAVAGAILGPVVGGGASVVGTRAAFGAVAAASVAMMLWTARTPVAPPGEPQSLRVLLHAVRDRRILLGVWFIVLPALLFGTVTVLVPLRLAVLGFGGVGIGAVWLVGAVAESAANVVVGRLTDRLGPFAPLRLALAVTVVSVALLPLPDERFLLGGLAIVATIAFGTFYVPGMSILTERAEQLGLEYGYAFAFMNLAWAPGQSVGSALSGAVAGATGDWVPYAGVGLCALATLVAMTSAGKDGQRTRATTSEGST